ncbi:MAG TPA: hypothetical protein VHA80_12630 [Solirubrobacterales bacterium]|nr:hypothetical protein [Solirubrobacterales bacterium]
MSILDDAIREHLELKRAHGADDAELKRLEDEAFGPPQRPDEVAPFAEAPTEFLASPGETAADAPAIADEHQRSGRRPDVADLQEPPPAPEGTPEDEHSPAPDAPPPSPADAADLPLPPPPAEGGPVFFDQFSAPPTDEEDAPPLFDEPPAPEDAGEHEEEHPAGEHEVVADVGPTTEEREAIADQPTQMFDVQAHVEAEAAADAPATGERESPSDEELLDAAQGQPQAAPPAPEGAAPAELHEQPPLESRGPDAEVAGHPPAEAEPEEGSAEFDFFNEQRLAEELDQALEAPLPPTDEHLAMPRYEDQPAEEAVADEDPETEYDPETGHEDVLEDTPRFLEDAPEDDDLWFEQKPPKDFDLD